MHISDAQTLIDKYLKGGCTPDEAEIVEKAFELAIEDQGALHLTSSPEEIRVRTWNNIQRRTDPDRWSFLRRIYPYAAGLLLVIGAAIFYNQYRPGKNTGRMAEVIFASAVLPGGNKAYLQLANGQQLQLDDLQAGEIARQSGAVVNKANDSMLIYSPSADISTLSHTPSYNTIVTPKGGQFSVQLPDGSRVWLNAASSLKFPAAFEAGERKVELTGEAYFEIAKDARRPFVVQTAGQQVKVLGTQFNLNSYADEQVTITTLLEGSVSITSSPQLNPKILIPGQQAINNNGSVSVQPADANALAWKNGKIRFDNTELPAILRQISRWYNVEIRYEGPVSKAKFTGGISRQSDLATVLQILESGGVKFNVLNDTKGKVLIVRN